jgi:hypothetical protein
MIILSIGLPSSASTWLFNVIRDILSDREVIAFEATSLEALELPLRRTGTVALIKCHTVSVPFFRMLQLAGAKAIISLRDPRDATASVVNRVLPQPQDAIHNVSRSLSAVLTARSGLQSQILLYEDRFFEQHTTLLDLASFLNVRLSPAGAQDIFDRYSISNVRARLDSLREANSMATSETGLYDAKTMFNDKHIGDTMSGKWKITFKDVLAEEIDNLFGDVAKSPRLEIGTWIRFTEYLFSADGQVYQPEIAGPGYQLLWESYLPAGSWSIHVSGILPISKKLPVYICHSGNIIASGESRSNGRVDLAFDYWNNFHDDGFSVHVGAPELGPVDPTRPDRLCLEARYLGP